MVFAKLLHAENFTQTRPAAKKFLKHFLEATFTPRMTPVPADGGAPAAPPGHVANRLDTRAASAKTARSPAVEQILPPVVNWLVIK
jgi:hypothetical protein